jgi:hypothetical protein
MASRSFETASRERSLALFGATYQSLYQFLINRRWIIRFAASTHANSHLPSSDPRRFSSHRKELEFALHLACSSDYYAFFLGIWFHFFASALAI